MLPKLWIFNTYSLCLVAGIAACFGLFFLYMKKYGARKAFIYDSLVLASVVILFGILSATLFQYVFNLLNGDNEFGAMTFYGGLIGGAALFIIIYLTVFKKRWPEYPFMMILVIAPACITVAHAFGRIGCFCSGCCYGIETDGPLGVLFPGMHHKVYPTQLFEAGFLFILSGILFFLAYKFNFKYTMPIYLLGYGTWRFLIEFIRGDERGFVLFGLHPAQIISILAFVLGIVLIFVYKFALLKKQQDLE